MELHGTTAPGPAADEEAWRVGTAARYLNSGGIDFGIEPRKVRRWADDPGCQIVTVAGGGGRHRYVSALSVRKERARLLGLAGRTDPDWPAPPTW